MTTSDQRPPRLFFQLSRHQIFRSRHGRPQKVTKTQCKEQTAAHTACKQPNPKQPSQVCKDRLKERKSEQGRRMEHGIYRMSQSTVFEGVYIAFIRRNEHNAMRLEAAFMYFTCRIRMMRLEYTWTTSRKGKVSSQMG